MSIEVGLVNPKVRQYNSIRPNDMAQLLSIEKAEEEAKKSPAAKVQKALFPTLIGSLIVASAAKTKGTPAQKLTVGAIGALSYLLLDKSFDVAQKASDKLLPQDKKNGALSLVGTIGGGVGLYGLTTSLLEKCGKKIASKTSPKTAQKVINGAKKIDSSKTVNTIMNAIAKPFKAFGAKFPKVAGFISKNYFPIGIAGFLLANMALSAKIQKDKVETYNKTLDELNKGNNIEGAC